MKTLQCRLHGGTFQITPKRGRPPTNCGGAYGVCSRFPLTPEEQRKVARATGGPVMPAKRATRTKLEETTVIVGQPEEAPEAPRMPMVDNVSVRAALAARERLEPLGWLCKGRAFEDDEGYHAEVMATRDEELINLQWTDGILVSQFYSLWYEKPSANGKPKGSLSFDPDECTDRELVRALSGMKCTWWNVLGQKEESGVISATKIKIEHAYNGTGDEMPADRIVHFTDHTGRGFCAFRVGALLKVGN